MVATDSRDNAPSSLHKKFNSFIKNKCSSYTNRGLQLEEFKRNESSSSNPRGIISFSNNNS